MEFYQCFLEGLERLTSTTMPAGATRPSNQPRCASAAIRSIIRTLETSIELRGERIIWVRMEDAEASDVRESFMESSISRELQVLSSHTVHHFALIAMTLRCTVSRWTLISDGALDAPLPRIEDWRPRSVYGELGSPAGRVSSALQSR